MKPAPDPDKDPRADAKLKNLLAPDLETLWRFRHPEEGGEKLTLEAVAVEVERLFGFSVVLSTLSEFYRWLKLKRRFQERYNTINQILETAARDPKFTPEQIEEMGQVLFMTEGISQANSKTFLAAVKVGQGRTKLKQDAEGIKLAQQRADTEREKLEAAKKSKIAAGLEALFAEIQGNPRAVELFKGLQAMMQTA